MDQKIRLLKDWARESSNIVFFGGAGVSTESGIPDFRSTDGIYHQQYDYPPEEILSHTFFLRNPGEFFRFYRSKMLCLDAKPNAAHRKLAQWEQEGKLKAMRPAAKRSSSCTGAFCAIPACAAEGFTMHSRS